MTRDDFRIHVYQTETYPEDWYAAVFPKDSHKGWYADREETKTAAIAAAVASIDEWLAFETKDGPDWYFGDGTPVNP